MTSIPSGRPFLPSRKSAERPVAKREPAPSEPRRPPAAPAGAERPTEFVLVAKPSTTADGEAPLNKGPRVQLVLVRRIGRDRVHPAEAREADARVQAAAALGLLLRHLGLRKVVDGVAFDACYFMVVLRPRKQGGTRHDSVISQAPGEGRFTLYSRRHADLWFVTLGHVTIGSVFALVVIALVHGGRTLLLSVIRFVRRARSGSPRVGRREARNVQQGP